MNCLQNCRIFPSRSSDKNKSNCSHWNLIDFGIFLGTWNVYSHIVSKSIARVNKLYSAIKWWLPWMSRVRFNFIAHSFLSAVSSLQSSKSFFFSLTLNHIHSYFCSFRKKPSLFACKLILIFIILLHIVIFVLFTNICNKNWANFMVAFDCSQNLIYLCNSNQCLT